MRQLRRTPQPTTLPKLWVAQPLNKQPTKKHPGTKMKGGG